MENKYYNPTQEEFHIGLRYEYLTNGDQWVSHSINNWGDFRDVEEDNKENKIRVKSLDQEDVKELGWIHYDKIRQRVGPEGSEWVKGYDNGDYTLYMMTLPTKRVEIKLNGHTVFLGDIKNYNELKIIMKQIGINGEYTK